MAEPLLGSQQYIAEWDADTDELSLTGTLPGPAGVHEADFAGIMVALDAADLAVVNLVMVDHASQLATDPMARRLFDRLVGDDLARTAKDFVGRVLVGRPRIGHPTTSRRGIRGVDPDMARLTLAMSSADAPGLTRDERALAQLEALSLAHRLDLHDHVPGFAERLQDAAQQIVDSTLAVLFAARGLNGSADSEAGELAARLCEQAGGVLTDELLAARLRRVGTDIRARLAEQQFSVAAAAMPFPAQSAARGAVERTPIAVALDSLPNLVAALEPSIERTSHDEYTVRLAHWAERAAGWWVRAFRAADTVPLAVVPMTSDGDDAVARFLVTVHDAASLVIDIVSDPAEPRASEQIATFRAAIATGKRAARLERLYRPDEARAAWRQASDLHASAGDSWRQKTAYSRSNGPLLRNRGQRGLIVSPVVADLMGPNA